VQEESGADGGEGEGREGGLSEEEGGTGTPERSVFTLLCNQDSSSRTNVLDIKDDNT